jgi:peptide/nickel transport system substrate-binding protein
MTSLRKRLTLTASAVLAASLVLTGCAGGAGEGGGSGTMLPDEQQVLTYVPNYSIQALNIAQTPLEIGVNKVVSQVMEPLVRFDGEEIVPVLATEWEWVEPTTLEIKLREGVTFSDGAAFTANDVVATLEHYIEVATPLAAIFSVIESVEAADDRTVVINTSRPTGTLVGILSMVYIAQGDKVKDDSYWTMPLGTGPFVFEEYVADDHVTMVRNDDYWGEKAKLRELIFKLIPDINNRITALSTGEVQVVNGIPFDQFSTVEGIEDVEIEQTASLNYWFLWFENSRTPLDDVRVRTAMWEALDLPTIISSLYGDTAEPMDSFCPSSAFGCLPSDGFPTYDPEHAKELLAEAGYPDGFETDIIFNTGIVTGTPLVQAMISAWNEIGVKVEPRGLDSATWLAEFQALNWDMDVQPNQTITGDADYTLNRLYSCAAKRLGYCNPELDEIMAAAQAEADEAERTKLYQEVIDIMTADVPAIPLFQMNINVAKRSNVQGLVIPPTEFVNFAGVYLTE